MDSATIRRVGEMTRRRRSEKEFNDEEGERRGDKEKDEEKK